MLTSRYFTTFVTLFNIEMNSTFFFFLGGGIKLIYELSVLLNFTSQLLSNQLRVFLRNAFTLDREK